MKIPESTLFRLETQLEALPVILDPANVALAEIPPKGGGWSAKENFAHLARHAELFVERMERILREDRPHLGTYSAELDPMWSSWVGLPIDEVLNRLRASRERLLAWVKGLSEDQVSRVGIHPVLGEMIIGRWLEFFLLHEAHHLYNAMRRLGEARRSRA